MTHEKEFFDKLVDLTTHVRKKLNELHRLHETNNIEHVEEIEDMLRDLQILTASVDAVAKILVMHIEGDEDE